jgi:hypothetical protein
VSILIVLAVIMMGGIALVIALCFYAGWWFAGTRVWPIGQKRMFQGLTATCFAAVASLVIVWKFFPETWKPLPQIEFVVPKGFSYMHVFMLEDSRAPSAGIWTGFEAPFFSKTLVLEMPASGVLRMSNLPEVLNTRFTQRGQPFYPFGCKSAGLGATDCLGAAAFAPEVTEAPPPLDGDQFIAYLLKREKRR